MRALTMEIRPEICDRGASLSRNSREFAPSSLAQALLDSPGCLSRIVTVVTRRLPSSSCFARWLQAAAATPA